MSLGCPGRRSGHDRVIAGGRTRGRLLGIEYRELAGIAIGRGITIAHVVTITIGVVRKLGARGRIARVRVAGIGLADIGLADIVRCVGIVDISGFARGVAVVGVVGVVVGVVVGAGRVAVVEVTGAGQ